MSRKVTHSEEWWATAPAHVLRCTGHYKSTGERCRREATPGTSVCNQHGALAPVVQAKAAARIQMSVDDAAKKLLSMVEDPNVEARDKIKILHDLLDRGGLAATQKHLVGVASVDPVERLFQDLLGDPEAFAAPALTSAKNVEEDPDDSPLLSSWDDDIVDAEVVEDARPTPAQVEAARQPAKGPGMPKHIREAMEELL